jgi:hypothetical protein
LRIFGARNICPSELAMVVATLWSIPIERPVLPASGTAGCGAEMLTCNARGTAGDSSHAQLARWQRTRQLELDPTQLGNSDVRPGVAVGHHLGVARKALRFTALAPGRLFGVAVEARLGRPVEVAQRLLLHRRRHTTQPPELLARLGQLLFAAPSDPAPIVP